MDKIEIELSIASPAKIKLDAATATLTALREMAADAELLVAKYAIEANQPTADAKEFS